MIEAALYFALGALSISLLLFVILPIVSGRARRLAIHELERQAPVSLSEITAQKDQMRARFAVELNRQEKRADQLQVESQQHLVTAEKWRIFAEHVEQEFEKLKNDYASLKKKISTAEVSLEKQKEIAKSALKTMTGQEKKRLFELEDEVEELRSDKSAANVRIVSIQTELNNAQSRVSEMERHMPSLEELNLRKELKALAEDVSAFVKSTPPPAPIVPPAPVIAEPTVAIEQPPVVEELVMIAEPAEIITPIEPTVEPEVPEKFHEEAAASAAVIPVFLKPAAERQYTAPIPTVEKQEIAAEAPQEGISEGSKITTLQFASSQSAEKTVEPTPSEPQKTNLDSIPASPVLAGEQITETSVTPMPINGNARLLNDSDKSGRPETKVKMTSEPVAPPAVISGKRIKQDKSSKTKKAGFAGIIAAVSRSKRGTMSSGANGKVKSAPVQYSGKMSLKNLVAKPAAMNDAEVNGTGPEKAGPNSPESAPKDGIAAKNRKKIVKFGKKARRIKSATASS